MRNFLVASCLLLVVSCGGEVAVGRRDPGTAIADAGSPSSYDFEAFRAAVNRSVDGAQSPHNCAAPISSVSVDSAAQMLEQVRGDVAQLFGVLAADVDERVSPCGNPNWTDCATQFQHDLFKADGRLGTALFPVAQQILTDSTEVREVVWSPRSGTTAIGTGVSIQGLRDDRLLGILFLFGRARCAL